MKSKDQIKTLLHIKGGKQLLLFKGLDQQMGREDIDELIGVFDLIDRFNHLIGDLFVIFDILTEQRLISRR